MSKINVDDIDRLFREGLNPEKDHSSIPEGDWSKLKERLHPNEKKIGGIFWLSRLSGVAAFILLFFAIRSLLPESRKPVIQQAEVLPKDLPLKEVPNPSPASPKEIKTVRKTLSESNAMLAQNKPLHPQTQANQTIVVPSSEKPTPLIDTVRLENLSTPKVLNEKTAKAEEPAAPSPDQLKTPEPKRSSADEPLFTADEKPTVKPETEHQLRLLSLSILAAPDYNGVNNLNNASLGNDLGLMLTLKFADNWSFSTGGIYARKLYQTGFNNYNPTKNIWSEYYPNSVSADCRVLDIPININYTLLKWKNNTFSLGSGISSYIMLREDYHFTYAEANSNNPKGYSVVNENKHWLSVLNLQASFEQRLNPRLSISLQPYLKIPLTNIGFAGVKLQSLGMAANLNWNFR